MNEYCSFDVAMKEHGQIKQVSAFSLIVVRAMCLTLVLLLLSQNKYRGIPGTAVFFHGKYRGRNFEYRPSHLIYLTSSYVVAIAVTLHSLCTCM